MEKELYRLNCLRSDFMKYADSFEPSTWEISLNEIKGHVNGFRREEEPVILLDCSEGEGKWFLCTDSIIEDFQEGVIRYYPLEKLSEKQVYEIRRIIETWLAKKDVDSI